MAINLNVDVDDNKFTEFKDKVEALSKKIESITKQLSKASQKQSDLQDEAARLQLESINSSFNNVHDTSKKTHELWKNIANYSKIAAGGIADATISLLKWGGIATAVAGGAVIGASIIGLGEMAKFSSTASTGRKNALSLGTTYGNMNSFEVNFERLVNSRRILSMVNEARHDPNLLVGMLGARGDDTADMAADFVLRLKELVDNTPDQYLANVLQSRKVPVSLQEATRLKGLSREEVQEVAKSYRKDKPSLSISPSNLLRWQDLSTQLDRSKQQITTVFIDNLVKLTPGLTKISDAFTHLIQVLLKEDGPIARLLDKLDDGLLWLDKKLSSPEFEKTISNFFKWLKQLAHSTYKFVQGLITWAQKFGILPGNNSNNITTPGQTSSLNTPGSNQGSDHTSGSHIGGSSGRSRGGSTGGVASKGSPGWWTPERMQHAYDRLTQEGGLSDEGAKGLIARWAFVESTGGPTSSNNIGGGHIGIAQWSRSRAGALGINASSSFDDQLSAALKEFNGSEAKAASYLKSAKTPNEGASGAARFERAEHYDGVTGLDDWVNKTMSNMDQVDKAIAARKNQANTAMPKQATTSITINKSAGASTPVAGAALVGQ